jgi:hypothetical protein
LHDVEQAIARSLLWQFTEIVLQCVQALHHLCIAALGGVAAARVVNEGAPCAAT